MSETHPAPQVTRYTLLALALVLGWCALVYGDLGTWGRAVNSGVWVFGDLRGIFVPMFRFMWAPDPEPLPGFFYGPTSAVLGMPLALLPNWAAYTVWIQLQALSTVGLAGACAWWLHEDGAPRWLVRIAPLSILALLPTWQNFVWAQTSTLRLLLVLMATRWVVRNAVVSAVLVALTGSLKPTGWLVLPWFWGARRRGFAPSLVAAAFGFGFVLPSLVLGPLGTLVFLRRTLAVTSAATQIHRDPSSQFMAHTLGRWTSLGTALCTPGRVLGLVLALGMLWVCARLARSEQASHRWLGLGCTFGLPCLLVPTAWPHDFVALGLSLGVVGWVATQAGLQVREERAVLAVLALLGFLLTGFTLPLYPSFHNWAATGLLFVAQLFVFAAGTTVALQELTKGGQVDGG